MTTERSITISDYSIPIVLRWTTNIPFGKAYSMIVSVKLAVSCLSIFENKRIVLSDSYRCKLSVVELVQ